MLFRSLYINGTNYGNIGQYMPLNTWCHFVLTRVSNVCTLYINGTSVWTATISGVINSNSEGMYIGKSRHTSAQYFTGSIGSLHVYKDVGFSRIDALRSFSTRRSQYGL